MVARGRECKWNTPADYNIDGDVLTFISNCTSIVQTDNNMNSGFYNIHIPVEVTNIGPNAFLAANARSITFAGPIFNVNEDNIIITIHENAFNYNTLEYISFATADDAIGFARIINPAPISNSNSNLIYFAIARDRTPCYEGNYHSDACKKKITTEYNKAQFIDLYTYGNYTTCN